MSFGSLLMPISKILFMKLLLCYCKTTNNIQYFASYVYLCLIVSLNTVDSFIAIECISLITPSFVYILYNKHIAHLQEDISASHVFLRYFHVIIFALAQRNLCIVLCETPKNIQGHRHQMKSIIDSFISCPCHKKLGRRQPQILLPDYLKQRTITRSVLLLIDLPNSAIIFHIQILLMAVGLLNYVTLIFTVFMAYLTLSRPIAAHNLSTSFGHD